MLFAWQKRACSVLNFFNDKFSQHLLFFIPVRPIRGPAQLPKVALAALIFKKIHQVLPHVGAAFEQGEVHDAYGVVARQILPKHFAVVVLRQPRHGRRQEEKRQQSKPGGRGWH